MLSFVLIRGMQPSSLSNCSFDIVIVASDTRALLFLRRFTRFKGVWGTCTSQEHMSLCDRTCLS